MTVGHVYIWMISYLLEIQNGAYKPLYKTHRHLIGFSATHSTVKFEMPRWYHLFSDILMSCNCCGPYIPFLFSYPHAVSTQLYSWKLPPSQSIRHELGLKFTLRTAQNLIVELTYRYNTFSSSKAFILIFVGFIAGIHNICLKAVKTVVIWNKTGSHMYSAELFHCTCIYT